MNVRVCVGVFIHIVPENKLSELCEFLSPRLPFHISPHSFCGPGLGAWVLAASFYYLAARNSWELGDLTCSIEMFLLR